MSARVTCSICGSDIQRTTFSAYSKDAQLAHAQRDCGRVGNWQCPYCKKNSTPRNLARRDFCPFCNRRISAEEFSRSPISESNDSLTVATKEKAGVSEE